MTLNISNRPDLIQTGLFLCAPGIKILTASPASDKIETIETEKVLYRESKNVRIEKSI